jgi:hypothetical protein
MIDIKWPPFGAAICVLVLLYLGDAFLLFALVYGASLLAAARND